MSRVATLSDDELKIVELIRRVAKESTVAHQSATRDMRGELEEIYKDLVDAPPYMMEETLIEVRDRIYRMLY